MTKVALLWIWIVKTMITLLAQIDSQSGSFVKDDGSEWLECQVGFHGNIREGVLRRQM